MTNFVIVACDLCPKETLCMFGAIVMFILFPMALYHFTKRVIKTTVASRGFFFPNFERLDQVRDFGGSSWNSWGKVRRRIFYYLFYVPSVLFMLLFDAFYLFMFSSLVYQLIKICYKGT